MAANVTGNDNTIVFVNNIVILEKSCAAVEFINLIPNWNF
jgi:hypothetical protein